MLNPSVVKEIFENVNTDLDISISMKECMLKHQEKDSYERFLMVYAYFNEIGKTHLQVFTQNGVCVFSGTDAYTADEMYAETPSEHFTKHTVEEHWSFPVWCHKHGFYNYDVEYPDYVLEIGMDQFINKNVVTVSMYGESGGQDGECSTCGTRIVSDKKRIHCPKCGGEVGLT